MSAAEYVEGVRRGDRTTLGRAITLVESTRPEHQELAQQMLVELLPHAGKSQRVGITGVPGAGKSTFIDALGTNLTSEGHRVAVLAVDPTSSRTGGSILGDRTSMQRLSVDSAASRARLARRSSSSRPRASTSCSSRRSASARARRSWPSWSTSSSCS
jgi:LAO/AO transport system kinase